MTPVQQLQKILNRANVSDDEIRGGITLSDGGCHKLAARLGTTPEEIKTLINTLTATLRDEHNDAVTAEGEADDLFVFEADYMGNLTIRNTKSGEEYYFSGSESIHIMKSLSATRPDSREEQLILQRAISDNGSINEDLETDSTSDFMSELRNELGSFNFPWRSSGRHGTATAAYRSANNKFDMHIISIRDHRGDEIVPDNTAKQDIKKQAREFIGKE